MVYAGNHSLTPQGLCAPQTACEETSSSTCAINVDMTPFLTDQDGGSLALVATTVNTFEEGDPFDYCLYNKDEKLAFIVNYTLSGKLN